mgnify:CR=1 FL=1
MVKQFKVKLKSDIDTINATTLTAKEKEIAITAQLALYVARGEDIVEDV